MGKETQCMNCEHFNEDEGNCMNTLAPIYDQNGQCKEYEAKADPDRWIPVTERLPENEKAVLATIVKIDYMKHVYADIVYCKTNCTEINWYGINQEKVSVIAWRPLPEPYKKKEIMGLFGIKTEDER